MQDRSLSTVTELIPSRSVVCGYLFLTIYAESADSSAGRSIRSKNTKAGA